jgi:hypothetical protein
MIGGEAFHFREADRVHAALGLRQPLPQRTAVEAALASYQAMAPEGWGTGHSYRRRYSRESA